MNAIGTPANETVVITGASGGIGRLLARHLAKNGTNVIAIARPGPALDELAAAVRHEPLVAIPADVTRPSAVADAVDEGARLLGPPTMLLTCAGTADALGPISTIDVDRWWQAVTVDLRGTMLAIRSVLHWMVPAGHGRIVTVYGNLGDRGQPHVSAFAAAKAGIARLTETLASELSGSGVIALGIHPGFVRTAMTERLATSVDAQRWMPDFNAHAHDNWTDGAAVVELVDRVARGAADSLAGRILHVDDDLDELVHRAASDDDLARLRWAR